MPPVGTPSPFRLPNTRPRSTRGPQFASTPRFLLSQRVLASSQTKNDGDDDINPADVGDLPYSSPVAARRAPPRSPMEHGSASRRKELIEDSEDELQSEHEHEHEHRSDYRDVSSHQPSTITAQTSSKDLIDSSSSNSPEYGGESDDPDFDMLFGPVPSNRASKRRRVSLGHGDTTTSTTTTTSATQTPAVQRRRSSADPILSSSPGDPSSSYTDLPVDLPCSPVRPRAVSDRDKRQTPRAMQTPNFLATPENINGGSSMNTTHPFINHRRFVFPATQQQQQQPLGNFLSPQTPAPTSPLLKQKPTFILPRSPSPSRQTGSDAPLLSTPLSPSSRILHRRGRGGPRSGAPGYLPGGMASEVRSWVLEMGMKREQVDATGSSTSVMSSTPVSIRDSAMRDRGTDLDSENPGNYHITVRIEGSRLGSLSGSNSGPGPSTFVKGYLVTWHKTHERGHGYYELQPGRESRNILLLGPPRSKLSSDCNPSDQTVPVEPGSVVAVRRGLVWEVRLNRQDATQADSGQVGHDRLNEEENSERWLVGMEWDIL